MTGAPAGCADAVRRMWDFIEGDLAIADRRAVEAHLQWCIRCCGELAMAREVRRKLRSLAGGDMPDPVRDRLEQFIDDLEEPSGEEAVS
jgi:anti-sigma factor RsiW